MSDKQPRALLTVYSDGSVIFNDGVTVGDVLQITETIRQRVLGMTLAPAPQPPQLKPQEPQP